MHHQEVPKNTEIF